jgi:hypothetical protein
LLLVSLSSFVVTVAAEKNLFQFCTGRVPICIRMIAAVDYYYNTSDFSSTELLPSDPVGQDFIRIFNPHYWDFIYGRAPKNGKKVRWYTESRYPLEARIFWKMYKDPKQLLGLSFGEETNYFVLDVDWFSQYHPLTNKYLFREILGILEDIGLCRPIIIQSSESGGLHVYYFLPYPIHSYTLSAAITQHLYTRGFEIDNGQLELYPNPKKWSREASSFKAIRCPLQAGSFVLNKDYQPVHNDIALFLEEAELTSTLQDMDTLTEALGLAQEWSEKQFVSGERKMSTHNWRNNLEVIMGEGWTGFGQTNEILKKIATYGVVFKELQGKELYEYISRKAQSLPNYYIFCRHQHEIDRRAREVGKWAESYPYLIYAQSPIRDITYKEHSENCFGKNANASGGGNKVVAINKRQETHQKTMEKVTEVIGLLKQEGSFPERATARGNAIIAKSKEVYKQGVSPNTLRKEEYRVLWHPLYEVVEVVGLGQLGVIADCERVSGYFLPDVWEELENQEGGEGVECVLGEYLSDWERYWWDRELESRENKGLKELHPNSIYEGIRFLGAAKEPELERASDNSQELGLETIQLENNLINELKVKFHLILISSFLVQITVLILLNIDSICVLAFSPLWRRYVLLAHESTEERNRACEEEQQPSPVHQSGDGYQAQQPALQTDKIESSQVRLTSPAGDNQGQIEDKETNSCNGSFNTDTTSGYHQPALTQAPDNLSSHNDSQSEITPLQWQEAKFKMETLQKAKQQLNIFCNVRGVRLMPQIRDQLRQFLQHCLMDKSPYPALREQAWQWFASHQEIINQIKDFTDFWDYFEDLAY